VIIFIVAGFLLSLIPLRKAQEAEGGAVPAQGLSWLVRCKPGVQSGAQSPKVPLFARIV
jgi:hypothetical protein